MPSSAGDAKRQGELAEVLFLARAVALGWQVSKPYGERSAYDFVVDCDGVLRRVQVKSVGVAYRGAYRVASGSGHSSKRAYTRADIDVLAAYVIPEATWYLIPVGAFAPVKSIHLRPGSKRRFERYREAWWVLGVRASGNKAQGSRHEAQGARRKAQGARLSKAQGARQGKAIRRRMAFVFVI